MKATLKTFILIVMVSMAMTVTACGGDDPSFSVVTDKDDVTAAGLPEPRPVESVPVFSGIDLDHPTFLTSVPGEQDRLAVAEQDGRIVTFANDDDVTASETLLDISGKVVTGGEEGLIGIAFDPGFQENGEFYVHYTAGSPRRSVISRFTVDPDNPGQADPLTEEIILEQEQPFSNHNGGMLAFGPDGMFYIAFGDGGSSGDPNGNGQNLSMLLGKILRVDVKRGDPYAIPDDNPFIGVAGARGEIWAYGFRNPYRFSFDRETGALWAGDVGERSREEVDLVVRGGNYGWNLFEGSEPFRNPEGRPAADFIAPITDYARSQGISVIGGYVYRGSLAPGLRGTYIFGDFGSGKVWALVYDPDTGAAVSVTEVAGAPSISSFGEDRAGELYAVSLEGKIFRLEGE